MGEAADERPDFTKEPQKFVAWNMLKRQRDQARKVAYESDVLMQAIEAAPEIESAMQVAFNFQQQPVQAQNQSQRVLPRPGYQGGAPR